MTTVAVRFDLDDALPGSSGRIAPHARPGSSRADGYSGSAGASVAVSAATGRATTYATAIDSV